MLKLGYVWFLFLCASELEIVLTQNVTNEDVHERFVTPCTTPNGRTGLCIEIQKCKIFMKVIEERKQDSFSFIKASKCGPSNEDPLKPRVCCGDDIHFVNQDANAVQSNSQEYIPAKDITTPLPLHLRDPLPTMCGTQRVVINNRIVGGQEASIGEFPWMARIIHRNSYNYTSLGCSAFVIHRKFALTAAHCVKGLGVQALGGIVGVILGSHNSTREGTCVKSELEVICSPTPKYIESLTPIVHLDYELKEHTNDIALIPFKEKIVFTDFIKAICLPKFESNVPDFTISGWGKTESDTGSPVKLKVTLPRVDRGYCDKRYRTIGRSILENQLCAGGVSGQDSCAGDSGGPLMAFNVQDQKWYAEGIVSYGLGCGREEWPGVYTNIPKYYNWIVDTIRRNKPE
ncbi:phenoloxidase-activating factor 1-like [Onthophagus taurus]|uniref:phenoloxidase-activating factor 1-like n=1 Tax=Onthophagus taurus TaxID=166361 RepID=UPI0039BE4EA7